MSIQHLWKCFNVLSCRFLVVPWLICACASNVVVAQGVGAVEQAAEDVLKCFNWGDSEAGVGRMNQEGMADYLIWQWFNAKRISDICEDPERVPEVVSLNAICEEHDIDLEPLLRSQNVLRDTQVSENLQRHHAQFRQASSKLMRKYSEEQLRVIALKVARTTQRLTHCPYKFEVGELSQADDQVVVQALLASAMESEQPERRGNLPAPLYLRFEKHGKDWLFAGIDEKSMLADQLKVATETDLSKIYIPTNLGRRISSIVWFDGAWCVHGNLNISFCFGAKVMVNCRRQTPFPIFVLISMIYLPKRKCSTRRMCGD